MADNAQPPTSGQATPPAPTSTTPHPAAASKQPPRPRNPALRLLGLPAFPRKLPSRNWSIFLLVTGAITSAIVYDRREKRRATAKWRRLVTPLASEKLPSPSQMPRRLSVVVAAPPGDGFRPAQEVFSQYVRPILAASGLDWEFVQGRGEGDVRAAVAERVRRWRREHGEGGESAADAKSKDYQKQPGEPPKPGEQTTDEIVQTVRRRNQVPEWDGVAGDVVIGRHTWKEYVRGLHEGWLGPVVAPPEAVLPPEPEQPTVEGEAARPKRPRQIPPYNKPGDYDAEALPGTVPPELLAPAVILPLPHILGFMNTPTRTHRFFTKRYLADEVGREVAAVCLATYRDFRENQPADGGFGGSGYDGSPVTGDRTVYEQQGVLKKEEGDWPKSVWKADDAAAKKAEKKEPPPPKSDDADGSAASAPEQPPPLPKERIWTAPMVVDSRIAMRMRRFELTPEDAARAASIVVPEEEVEGWIKGSLRGLWRQGAESWRDGVWFGDERDKQRKKLRDQTRDLEER